MILTLFNLFLQADLVTSVEGFEDAIRKFVCHVICITYQVSGYIVQHHWHSSRLSFGRLLRSLSWASCSVWFKRTLLARGSRCTDGRLVAHRKTLFHWYQMHFLGRPWQPRDCLQPGGDYKDEEYYREDRHGLCCLHNGLMLLISHTHTLIRTFQTVLI